MSKKTKTSLDVKRSNLRDDDSISFISGGEVTPTTERNENVTRLVSTVDGKVWIQPANSGSNIDLTQVALSEFQISSIDLIPDLSNKVNNQLEVNQEFTNQINNQTEVSNGLTQQQTTSQGQINNLIETSRNTMIFRGKLPNQTANETTAGYFLRLENGSYDIDEPHIWPKPENNTAGVLEVIVEDQGFRIIRCNYRWGLDEVRVYQGSISDNGTWTGWIRLTSEREVNQMISNQTANNALGMTRVQAEVGNDNRWSLLLRWNITLSNNNNNIDVSGTLVQDGAHSLIQMTMGGRNNLGLSGFITRLPNQGESLMTWVRNGDFMELYIRRVQWLNVDLRISSRNLWDQFELNTNLNQTTVASLPGTQVATLANLLVLNRVQTFGAAALNLELEHQNTNQLRQIKAEVNQEAGKYEVYSDLDFSNYQEVKLMINPNDGDESNIILDLPIMFNDKKELVPARVSAQQKVKGEIHYFEASIKGDSVWLDSSIEVGVSLYVK